MVARLRHYSRLSMTEVNPLLIARKPIFYQRGAPPLFSSIHCFSLFFLRTAKDLQSESLPLLWPRTFYFRYHLGLKCQVGKNTLNTCFKSKTTFLRRSLNKTEHSGMTFTTLTFPIFWPSFSRSTGAFAATLQTGSSYWQATLFTPGGIGVSAC